MAKMFSFTLTHLPTASQLELKTTFNGRISPSFRRTTSRNLSCCDLWPKLGGRVVCFHLGLGGGLPSGMGFRVRVTKFPRVLCVDAFSSNAWTSELRCPRTSISREILRTEKTHVRSSFGFDLELLSEVFEFVKGKTS